MIQFLFKSEDTDQCVKQDMGIKSLFAVPVGHINVEKKVTEKFMNFIKIKQQREADAEPLADAFRRWRFMVEINKDGYGLDDRLPGVSKWTSRLTPPNTSVVTNFTHQPNNLHENLPGLAQVSVFTRRLIGGNKISTDVNILDNSEFSDIKNILTEHVNNYFQKIVKPDDPEFKLYITNSWLNLNNTNEMHHIHKHPNSIVSCVLYINADTDDTITFLQPYESLFGNLNFSYAPNTDLNSFALTLPVVTNKCIMFPSGLTHFVTPRPASCQGTRISLAFNTWFKGIIGAGIDHADTLKCH